KFSITRQKATWQKQLFEIKQGTDTVDTYISHFKQLQLRVDPNNSIPRAMLVQFFIQGL
ncbi:15911_t:CDS:1, partial [Racocetra persica]